MSRRSAPDQRLRPTRERLLDAAATVFAQHGYHRTAVDEIAEQAGASKGSLYFHFASKEELFLAVAERRLERLTSAWQSAASASTPPISIDDLVQAWERRFLDQLAPDQPWAMLVLEFYLYAARDATLRARLAEYRAASRALIADILAQQYARAGTTPPASLQDLAWAVEAVDSGLLLQAVVEPETPPPPVYALALQRLLT